MNKMANLMFSGRVAIVTGAGGGLGKAYALMFAERGASVVVNDLGGDIKGDGGSSSKAADLVVNEIKSKNGIAVSNYDSVENADSIIKTAIDNFGRIDILVNNAGILRDKSFLRTSDLDWDLIHRIHLRSSFLLTRAAWPYMQKSKFGRIIMTSSAAGIYGNFGQSNYSAAKLGLLGLSNTLAIEGAKYNIKSNTIAPLAKSRLTETVMPEELLANLKPEYVAPLVLYLCHESCEETGSIFEVGAGWIGKLRWQKSSGKLLLNQKKEFRPEDVRDNWNEISSFEKPIYHQTIGESTNYAISMTDGSKVEENKSIEQVQSIGQTFSYSFKDTILYALSIRMTVKEDLKFLYENHDEFSVFPTFGVIPAQDSIFSNISNFELPQGVSLDPTRLLHGEHYLELYKPLAPGANLRRDYKLIDVLDKGSGASLIFNVESYDEANEKVSLNQFVVFLVGSGNFGGPKDSNSLFKVSNRKFDRVPDKSMEEKTSPDQAALYRLNGDNNPLHIDPQFASIGGFDKPILHGLCSFGIAVKHVLKMYCDNDVKLFKSVKARFNKPVIPEQTLKTNTWLEKENNIYKVYFECKVIETGNIVISGAYVELYGIKSAIIKENSKL